VNEIRFKFTRSEEVKYISHLDIMKVFERAIRRANIKIAYSKGFNPHPQIIFGLPMGVGLSSISEFADIFIVDNLSPERFIEDINRFLPKGYKVIEAKIKTAKGNVMSQIEIASYNITLKNFDGFNEVCLKDKLMDFISKDTITVLKENKSGKKMVDIRPLILELNIINFFENNIFVMQMLLKAGQNGNIKPELVIGAFNENEGLNNTIVSTVRTGLFSVISGNLVSPMDDKILLQLG
jgi:radical SAM-linked protein